MSAMTDRDRAVAEKILRGNATIYNTPYGWSYSPRDPISGITNDVILPIPKFCSNATWETEGMVWDFLRSDFSLLRKTLDALDADHSERMDNETDDKWDMSNVEYYLWHYHKGDLANALADVIMEFPDATPSP